jgi:multidrug efflux system outer membrane protein
LGRLSGQRAAERQDVLAAGALLQGTSLLIEAETARTWFIGRYFVEAAQQAHRISALLQEAQAIAAKREALGLAAPSASEMLRRRLDAAQLRESELVFQRDAAWRQLGFLLGETKAVTPGDPGTNPPPPEVPVGLPADLMRRRPDIKAAQASLIAADERLRSERKDWLPAIGLTASGGAASASLGQLLSSAASSFGLGVLLALPVFDGGRHKARVAGRQAQRDGAAAAYRETVLRALREVNDNLQTLQVRLAALDKAATAEREGDFLLSRSGQQLANGTQSRLGAIEFQVTALERKITRSDAMARALVASLNLIQALGGGWE